MVIFRNTGLICQQDFVADNLQNSLCSNATDAVISVGYNTYGHPSAEAMERMAAAGCTIYRTDWHGTVTITTE